MSTTAGRSVRVVAAARLETSGTLDDAARAGIEGVLAALGADGGQGPFARWLGEARRDGCLRLPSPAGDGVLECRHGVFCGSSNFLAFPHDRSPLWVVQHLHTADALYLPEHALAVRLPYGRIDPADIERFAAQHARSGRASRDAPFGVRAFRGVLTQAVSPYHFFYDCLPAFEAAHEAGTLAGLRGLTAIDGAHYLALARVFGDPLRVRARSAAHIEAQSGEGFHLLAGEPFRGLPRELIARLDARVLSSVRPPRWWQKSPVPRRASSGPRVWIGLCSRKRGWLNEAPLLRELLQRLAADYPRVEAVFDGSTAALIGAGSAHAHLAAERAQLRTIVSGLPRNVVVLSLIGAGSEAKLRAAAGVDCFLADRYTASMYPARFAGKPGLAWSSHAMHAVHAELHLHRRTRLLEAGAVHDEPAVALRVRPDQAAFRIEPAAFLAAALDVVRASYGEGSATRTMRSPAKDPR
ncbi:MAG: hypothetical protein CALGDGBN_02821 [Pseudomonadales bacterium]|nr:hypothetical protein [Pseudomonadales bacterium]